MEGSRAQADLVQLGERIDELIDGLEELPNDAIREDMLELIASMDALHREAFARLLALVRRSDPSLAEVVADPVLVIVLDAYDLLPGESLSDASDVDGSVIRLVEKPREQAGP